MNIMKSVFALAVAGALVPAAHAQNLVTNGSFESATGTAVTTAYKDAYRVTSTGGYNIDGWSITSGSQVHQVSNSVVNSSASSEYGVDTTFGTKFIDLTGGTVTNSASSDFGKGYNGTFSTSFATVAGQTYSLSFAAYDSSTLNTLSSYSIGVTVGSSTLATVTSAAMDNDTWETFTYSFVATGTTTTLGFTLSDRATNLQLVGLDNVVVTSAVPEPESMALFMSGLLMLGAIRRKASKKA